MKKLIVYILTISLFLGLCPENYTNSYAANETNGGRVFFSSSGRLGITPLFSKKSGSAVEWAELGNDGKDHIHISRTDDSLTDALFEFTPDYPSDGSKPSYVFEMDMYLNQSSGGPIIHFYNYDAPDNSGSFLTLQSNSLRDKYNGTSLMSVNTGIWYTIAVAINPSSGNCTLYTKSGDVYTQIGDYTLDSPIVPSSKIRVHLANSTSVCDVYFDNIKLYEGIEPRDVSPLVDRTESQSDVDSILKGAYVLMKDKAVVYHNGIKSDYASFGYTGYDDMYAELADNGKYIYEDSRGWTVISDTNLSLSNSKVSTVSEEYSDIIDRYMQFDRLTGDEIYNALVANNPGKNHPRIFLTDDTLSQLRDNIRTDKFLIRQAAAVIETADAATGLVTYNLVNEGDTTKLFMSCLNARDRLVTLCTAYLISTDEAKKASYAQDAISQLKEVCTWKDWNVSNHYLDSGKLGPGVAYAYDVLYDLLNYEERKQIRQALCDNYLYYAAAAYSGANKHKDIGKATSNWGAVCNGSVLMVCLATMDEESPDSEYTILTKYLAEQSLRGLERTIQATFPDGSWHEGIGYLRYVTEYLSWSAYSLKNSCGTDAGISSYPGVSAMADYAMYIHSPDKGYFNFSDGATASATYESLPEIFLIARLTDDMEMNDAWYNIKHNIIKTGLSSTFQVRDLLFYTPGNQDARSITYPLDKKFSSNEISVIKSGWEKGSIYTAAIGGRLDSHFDKGGFVFDSQGERWAIDLGKDNKRYTTDYLGQSGADIYKKRAEGHNVLVFDPSSAPGQKLDSESYITEFSNDSDSAYSIYDLSDAYSDYVSEYNRGFYLGNDRSVMTVRDEFTLDTDRDVYWFMHTMADIEIKSDSSGNKYALLSQNGKKLKVEFDYANLADVDVTCTDAVSMDTAIASAQGVTQDSTSGIRKLVFKAKASAGNGNIVATLTAADDSEYVKLTPVDMSEWKYIVNDYLASPEVNLTEGIITFVSKLENQYDSVIYLAAYKSDGLTSELVSLNSCPLTLTPGVKINTVENVSLDIQDYDNLKCMIWENNTMIPLSK